MCDGAAIANERVGLLGREESFLFWRTSLPSSNLQYVRRLCDGVKGPRGEFSFLCQQVYMLGLLGVRSLEGGFLFCVSEQMFSTTGPRGEFSFLDN